jgi:hypothetical protein
MSPQSSALRAFATPRGGAPHLGAALRWGMSPQSSALRAFATPRGGAPRLGAALRWGHA